MKCELSSWQKIVYKQVQNKFIPTLDASTGYVPLVCKSDMPDTKFSVGSSLHEVSTTRLCSFARSAIIPICSSTTWVTTGTRIEPQKWGGSVSFRRHRCSRRSLQEIYRCSGKFEILDRILPKLQRSNHKVLMFTQMTRVLDIMEDYMDWRRFPYLRYAYELLSIVPIVLLRAFTLPDAVLMGRRSRRRAPNSWTCSTHPNLRTFSSFSRRVPVVSVSIYRAPIPSSSSTRIGTRRWTFRRRTGRTVLVNRRRYTHAHTHTLGWLMVDVQVRVFRLVTCSPVEEQILQRAQYKLGLDHAIIQAGKFNKTSTAHERKEMLTTILKSGVDMGEEVDAPDDDRLNRMLARNEDEVTMTSSQLASANPLGLAGLVPRD